MESAITHKPLKIIEFKERSWEPVVEVYQDQLIYCVPVACGHFDKTFRFGISQQMLEVLKVDQERRYFLYALLHAWLQPMPETKGMSSDDRIESVLCGEPQDVERLLNQADARTNGSVSNLVQIYMNKDQVRMQAGHWFGELGHQP